MGYILSSLNVGFHCYTKRAWNLIFGQVLSCTYRVKTECPISHRGSKSVLFPTEALTCTERGYSPSFIIQSLSFVFNLLQKIRWQHAELLLYIRLLRVTYRTIKWPLVLLQYWTIWSREKRKNTNNNHNTWLILTLFGSLCSKCYLGPESDLGAGGSNYHWCLCVYSAMNARLWGII